MKKKRIRRTPWRWTRSNLVLDSEEQQLWLCPDLPPVRERSSYPVAVQIEYLELACPPTLNEALFAFWRAFGHDSVLAAIHCKHSVKRMFVYTTAPPGVAEHRCDDVRQELRPPVIALTVSQEPGWDALAELMSSVKNGGVQELLR